MGRLVGINGHKINTDNQDEIWLFHEHVFGRDVRCNTILKSNGVSRIHARISWNGSGWIVRDLGSRNGTFVNGKLLSSGECQQIKAGDRIFFGDFSEEYLMLEDDEPQALLITIENQTKEKRIPLTNLLPLPSQNQPLCTIFYNKNNDFFLENEDGGIIHLQHGNKFTVGNSTYQVVLDSQSDEGSQTDTLDMVPDDNDFHLDIAVSPDEECAEVVLLKGTEKYVLQPKVHFYLLAYLARIRTVQTDLQSRSNNAGDENGWVDCDLACKDLMINRDHLAQQVFRIRQDFKIFSSYIAEQIIDRHLRGKMRIGLPAKNISVSTMV